MEDWTVDLQEDLAELFGFRQVSANANRFSGVPLLLRKRTLVSNTAVAVATPEEIPHDLGAYVKRLRTRVAFRCGFFPVFYGLGLQLVIAGPGIGELEPEPKKHVARIDNQWAIVQSLFLVDPEAKSFRAGRSWGQVVTGPVQNQIHSVLEGHFRPVHGEF